jgi:hypothetical protein
VQCVGVGVRWERLFGFLGPASPLSPAWIGEVYFFSSASLGFLLFLGNPFFFLSRESNVLYISAGVFVFVSSLGQEMLVPLTCS